MSEVVDYIDQFPLAVKNRLNQIRKLILTTVPSVEESISYGMPAYKTFNKPLVYFAGYKNHIGFYATPTGHAQFAEALSKYKQGKGSVQFPLDEELPISLIEKIISFRKAENEAKYGKV